MSKNYDSFNEEAVVAATEEAPMTTEEIQDAVAFNENDLLKALKGEGEHKDETKTIIVKFRAATFSFRIRALSEREYDECREKSTKYQKNRRLGGMRLPEKTDTVGYHTRLIYAATVDEDKALLWDNKNLWAAANAVTGTDMVDKLIPLAGKKQQIVEQIELLSGFDDDSESNYEETVKN